MKIKAFFVIMLLLIASGISWASCPSAYVHQSGWVITVLPTNDDDTQNLQCAFEMGKKIPGATIQLLRGTYITGRIVVDGFVGTLRGKGMNATVVRNPNTSIYVTPDDCYMVPTDSQSFALPYLLVLLGGDYRVMDLTFQIVGSAPATDWSIFGIRNWLGHGITSLAGPVVILGSDSGKGYREANASFHRVRIKGEVTDDPLYGYNIYNGIFYEGFSGPDLLPLQGTFAVTDSEFEGMASSAPVSNVLNAKVLITGNRSKNVYYGSDIEDLKNSFYDFSHNEVSGTFGFIMYDNCLGGDSNCGTSETGIFIKNNKFVATNGVRMEGTFMDGTHCMVLGNNFSRVTDTAVYLGEHTSHCLVMGIGDGKVVDLGKDNIVMGLRRGPSSKSSAIGSAMSKVRGHDR